jgi:hypothetical protein
MRWSSYFIVKERKRVSPHKSDFKTIIYEL